MLSCLIVILAKGKLFMKLKSTSSKAIVALMFLLRVEISNT